MSYPYDINPWDDNYNAATTQGQSSYGGYTDGYSNPMAQYPENDMSSGQAQYDYGGEQTEQQQETDQFGPSQPSRPPDSTFKRFLRAHVPLCGPIMDICSAIRLPFLDSVLKLVNRDLLISKIFYFFFYSAFGSLFPLMGVYFKQLGMNPAQVGILTGVRPFIEIFSAPFWNSLAERFQKSKALLLFSLLSWIIFTYSLAHIRPPASACVAFNDTDYVLYTPYSANDLSNYDVGQLEESNETPAKSGENEMFMSKMPDANQEGKEGILASEENQNDQRRRRRRRRRQATYEVYGRPTEQLERPASRHRYAYSYDDKDESNGLGNEINIDIETDFEDVPLKSSSDADRSIGQAASQGPGAFYSDHEGATGSSPEYLDELEQSFAKVNGDRYKRHSMNYWSGNNEGDDVLGDSDEGEQQDENEEVKAGQRWRGKGESDTDQEDDEGAEGGDVESDTNNGGVNHRASVKHSGRQQEKANSVVTIPSTTTTLATGSASEHESEKPAEEETKEVLFNKTKRIYKQRHKTPPTHIVGMSPITVEYAVNYNREKHSQFVTPMFSTIVYKLDDIKEVFFLLLLLISLGEFFSAPAITIADSQTLSYLGENTDLYGRQRMFGSLSWAITLLLVGMALDNSKSIADHPCGPHQRERSYTVCFAIFSLLMACAFLTATQFRFTYSKGGSDAGRQRGGGQTIVTSTTSNNTVVTTAVDGATANIDELYASTQPRNIFNTAPPINAPPASSHEGREKFEFIDKWKSAVFAQSTWELPEWVNVFRQFKNSLHLVYLFITWFLGCGVGLVFTFLFWHLQDVGGTPTLFGICSVINHISEILAYFFSSHFIKRFGHTRVSIQLAIDGSRQATPRHIDL